MLNLVIAIGISAVVFGTQPTTWYGIVSVGVGILLIGVSNYMMGWKEGEAKE